MPAARIRATSSRRSSAVVWSGLRPVGMDDSETEVVSRVIYAAVPAAARRDTDSGRIDGRVQLKQIMRVSDDPQPVLRHKCDELLAVHERDGDCARSSCFVPRT